jgi:serine/threonine-protein kinase
LSHAHNDRLVGQVIADRYHIVSVLGEGGMGRVYLAEHVRMGRKSAVKVLSPNMALSADAISRFNREAANASRINHPNVAQIYDFGETSDGMLYLAMELVEGETLRSLIQRGGPLPIIRAAELTRQIADALGAAHHLGIVHRDLKPDNIILAKHHDGSDWVKVVDFGIAKTVQGSGGESTGGQTVTTAGVSLGTPEYMSPEQLAGERLDARTDLYSLGLVLFNMLTANLPYPRVTSKDTLVRRLTSRPQRLAEVVPSIKWPPALQTALDRALAPEAADRYATVGDFGRDVVAAARAADTVRTPAVMVRRSTSGPTERIDTPTPRAVAASTSNRVRNRTVAIGGAAAVLIAATAGTLFAVHNRNTAPRSTTVTTSMASPASNPTPRPTPKIDSVASVTPAESLHAKTDSAAAATTSSPAEKSVQVPVKRLVAEKQPAVSRTAEQPSSRAAIDSVAIPDTPPAQPSDTTRAGRDRAMANLRHTMLRSTGDTATKSSMPTTDSARIRVMGEDVQGHLFRAREFISQGDVPKARGEIRELGQVVVVLRQLYGGTPGEMRVEQGLRFGMNQTIAACRVALQDSSARARVPATFRCEQLLPQGMRGQRGRNPSAAWNP